MQSRFSLLNSFTTLCHGASRIRYTRRIFAKIIRLANASLFARIAAWKEAAHFSLFSPPVYHTMPRCPPKWNTPQQATGHHSLNAQQAAGYCTLAAVAKVMQAWLWLVARGNKKRGKPLWKRRQISTFSSHDLPLFVITNPLVTVCRRYFSL